MKKAFLFILCLGLIGSAAAQINQIGGAAVAANPSYSCSPSSIAFGNQVINVTSGQLNSRCTNNGNAIVTLTGYSIGDSHYTSGGSDTCHTLPALVPNQSCDVDIQFTPTALVTTNSSIVVTATGATGSPQTITLSGTGVNQGSNPPSGYTAPTGVAGAIGYTGITPLTSSNLPAEGGTILQDTNFVHCNPPWSPACGSTSTSSGGISGSQYGAEIQCMGSVAAAAAHGLYSGFPSNASWTTNNTGHANIITNNGKLDGSWIVGRGGGGSGYGFFFINFVPGNAKCTLEYLASAGNPVLGAGTDGPVASKTGGSDKALFYAWTPTANGLETIDFSGCNPTCSGGNPVITTLIANLNNLSPQPCGETLSNGSQNGYLRTVPDNTSLGHDNVVVWLTGTPSEGQNTWSCAVFYQRSSGAVAWWNVKTDSMGSTTSPAWTGGWPTCSNCTSGLVTGVSGLHGSESLSNDGNYLGLDLAGSFNPDQVYTILSVATQTVKLATAFDPLRGGMGGHGAFVGPNFITFSSGSTPQTGSMNAVASTNPNTSPGTFAFQGSRVGTAISGGTYQPDQHDSGNVVNAAGTQGLIYSLDYYSSGLCPGGASTCPQPTGIGGEELKMITPPPSSGTWTPTAYRFCHSMADAITDSNFYAQVSGNVAINGDGAAFTTNWGATLGNDNLNQPRKVGIICEFR